MSKYWFRHRRLSAGVYTPLLESKPFKDLIWCSQWLVQTRSQHQSCAWFPSMLVWGLTPSPPRLPADSLFGQQPEEVPINLCEARDKFMIDWCPETSPELEEMARAEEIRVGMEGTTYTPAIWIISDGIEPRAPRTGPRVAFRKNV